MNKQFLEGIRLVKIKSIDIESESGFKQMINYYLSITEETEYQVAEKVGVSYCTLMRWVKGRTAPFVALRAAIRDVLIEQKAEAE